MGSPTMHFWSGNEACVEGAIMADCKFFAGYPISPSNEIPELLSKRLPEVNGVFLQMEDEWPALVLLSAQVGPAGRL